MTELNNLIYTIERIKRLILEGKFEGILLFVGKEYINQNNKFTTITLVQNTTPLQLLKLETNFNKVKEIVINALSNPEQYPNIVKRTENKNNNILTGNSHNKIYERVI